MEASTDENGEKAQIKLAMRWIDLIARIAAAEQMDDAAADGWSMVRAIYDLRMNIRATAGRRRSSKLNESPTSAMPMNTRFC